jgi:hypothetical protein
LTANHFDGSQEDLFSQIFPGLDAGWFGRLRLERHLLNIPDYAFFAGLQDPIRPPDRGRTIFSTKTGRGSCLESSDWRNLPLLGDGRLKRLHRGKTRQMPDHRGEVYSYPHSKDGADKRVLIFVG